MRTTYHHPASTTGSPRGTTGRRTFLAAALASAGAGAVGFSRAAADPTAAAAAPASATSAAPPGLTVVVSSSAYATVHEALRAVPTSGTLLVDRSERVARPLVVDRSMTVLFAPGATLTSTVHATLVDVRASDVRIVDAVLVGAGASAAGAGRAVVATGTAASPLERVSIEACRITGFSHDGVLASNVVGLEVVECSISDVGYAGVLLISCLDSVVRGNAVTDVRQSAGYVNSYGIAVTRDESRSLADSPRSARVTVDGNTVTRVLHWEGIDTHAGESIVVRDNRVTGCSVGIAIVPCQDESRGQYVYAPTDVVVTGNHVERGEATRPGSGIVVKGAGSTVGSTSERATAVVEGNAVVGMGGGTREAGILLYLTRDVVVRGNVLQACEQRGIALYHSNDRTTVVRNRVVGLVLSPGSPIGAAIELTSTANTGTLLANTFEVGAVAPSPVRGVSVPGAGNVLDLVRNDWSATTLAVYGRSSTITRFADGP
ncbi:right-handed parallel beta-helix repeat-containing protein [Frigoribacterium sp. Leaf186]|uniref:right-handed parallel beta-helix repeat-containing protein n=1 Tax=Frigoribacterium sp. Leaf186 TaxID=1736293 RepID=UPI0012F8C9F2|nr:right-handed parallel beta-helix repeat-containing protein [Frigoribacterium sp. Leaf186]